MSISRNLIQIWIGDKPLPSHCAQWCAEWKGLHPKWDYKLWGNELYEKFENDHYVRWMKESGEKEAFISDRFRVLLLRETGGVYLDADTQPVRKLDSIEHMLNDKRVDFITGVRPPDRKFIALHRGVSLVDNTVMMSAQNGKMINRLCNLYRPESKRQSGYTMGIEVLRHCDDTVRLLNWRYFYSEKPYPETIFLHDDRNLGSWSNKVQINEAQGPLQGSMPAS